MSDSPTSHDSSDDHPDIAAMSYEQAREELIAVVQKLESGGVGLEESIALWERGERLAQACQTFLDGARSRLASATQSPDEATVSDPT